MHYFLYPSKDTYLSNDPSYIEKNVGLDEILQVDKAMSGDACASISGSMAAILSRALLQFDFATISQSISAGRITNPSFYLNLKVCESSEVPVDYSLISYPVAQSWVMGSGYKYDGAATSDGASWKFRDAGVTKWVSGSISDCTGGGVWFVSSGSIASGSSAPVTGGYASSQSFSYTTSDVSMDVTNMVNKWLSEEIPNHGLMVMYSDQTSSIDYGRLKFFSKETNTIYSPYIDVMWDDSTQDPTGSAGQISIDDAVVNVKNMMEEYKFGSIIRFNVVARQRYPVKTFTNRLSDYLTPYYLPTSSYYSIRDAESDVEIIPYDNYTKLSSDANGHFFRLDTTGLPQERYFKIEIRTEQSGSILTFPISTAFKISR